MKKLSKVLALSLAMALTFGMTVSAAGSTSTTNTAVTNTTLAQQAQDVQKDASAKTEDGQAVTVTVEATTVDKFDSAATAAKEQAKTLTKNDGTATVVAAFELKVDVADKPVTISVKVPGVKADGKYAFLHFDGAKWEVIAATNDNGTLTGTFKSLSPVAVVELKDGAEPAQNNNNNSNNNNSNTQQAAAPASAAESPKTGETVPVAGVMAVIMLAGAVICAKKYQMSK